MSHKKVTMEQPPNVSLEGTRTNQEENDNNVNGTRDCEVEIVESGHQCKVFAKRNINVAQEL